MEKIAAQCVFDRMIEAQDGDFTLRFYLFLRERQAVWFQHPTICTTGSEMPKM
jgi:hypothetical protein